MPRRLETRPGNAKTGQRGQSLVEFALSSVVLLLLVGGIADIGRAIYITGVLSNAVREGARHGAWFDAASQSTPYLYDAEIHAAVDQELTAASLPASVLRNPGSTCPSVTDGNAYHNPPYSAAAYPAAVNQPWLFICYANSAGTDFTSPPSGQGGRDLNVILLYTYAPLTPLLGNQLGTFHLAANEHMTVEGS